MRRAALLVLAFIGLGGVASTAQGTPRIGLRLDSRSSMQWAGDTLMLEGESALYFQLPVKTIVDVWPGPTIGAFAVVSDKGLGMLIGSTLAPSVHPYGANSMLRSSRPDVMFACVAGVDGSPRRRIIERRAEGIERDLPPLAREVMDFDVDIAGRVVVLTVDGRLLIATDKSFAEIPGTTSAPMKKQRLHRVFIDDRASEIAVLGDSALFRLTVSTGAWTSVPVDPRVDALVRHAASRRMRVEPKFVIPRS